MPRKKRPQKPVEAPQAPAPPDPVPDQGRTFKLLDGPPWAEETPLVREAYVPDPPTR